MNVSFVVIAYNEERNIARTLEAILAQEGLASYEVIVVNDGSKDGTLDVVNNICKQHKAVRIVDLQPNQGRGAARAAGVAAARGKHIAFVDADISLPSDWLQRCLPYMKTYDACGGIAVPDGDATFIYRVFGLVPKVAMQTTAITGNNGLFKREVFSKVAYEPSNKNGEDVALGYAMSDAGLQVITLKNLIVEHREFKTFIGSLKWLFESGIGAARQLYQFRQLRVPDIAFVGFIFLLATSLLCMYLLSVWIFPLMANVGYILLSSFMHLRGKFVLRRNVMRSAGAVVVNGVLLFAYYCGRFVGLVTEAGRK